MSEPLDGPTTIDHVTAVAQEIVAAGQGGLRVQTAVGIDIEATTGPQEGATLRHRSRPLLPLTGTIVVEEIVVKTAAGTILGVKMVTAVVVVVAVAAVDVVIAADAAVAVDVAVADLKTTTAGEPPSLDRPGPRPSVI